MTRPPARARFGATELTDEQTQRLRRAVRLEWISIGTLALVVAAMGLVAGRSQAMRTAWVQDVLPLLPPIVFLVSVRIARRSPTPRHPCGYHRVAGVGHLAAAAALVVSTSVVATGILHLRGSVTGLVDSRAGTYDDAAPHPLVREVETVLRQQPWARDVGVRVRAEGHVFHVEGFLAPAAGTVPTLEQLAAARRRCLELDLKIADVVLAPVAELPEDQVPR